MSDVLSKQQRESVVIDTVMSMTSILESLGYETTRKEMSGYVHLYESIKECKYDVVSDDVVGDCLNPYAELVAGRKLLNENAETVKSLNLVDFEKKLSSAIDVLSKIDDTRVSDDVLRIKVDIYNSFNIKGLRTSKIVTDDTLHVVYDRMNCRLFVVRATSKGILSDVDVYDVESGRWSKIVVVFNTRSDSTSFRSNVIEKLRLVTGVGELVIIYTNPSLIGFKFTDSIYRDAEQQSHLADIARAKGDVYLNRLLSGY